MRQFEAIPGLLLPMLQAGISLKTKSGGFTEPVDLGIDSPSEVWIHPLAVEAYLGVPPLQNGRVSDLATTVARGFPRFMRTNSLQLDRDSSADYDILFPIPPSTLSQLEEARAGGNPMFQMTLRIAGVFRHTLQSETTGGVPYIVPFVADKVPVVPHDSTDPYLVVERSRWIESILPHLGFGQWIIYEIPAENFEGSAQVDTYLNNAVRQFSAGEWKLAIAAARDVVETLKRELSAETNPAFGDRYGSAGKKMQAVADSYRQLVSGMLEFEGALKSLFAAGAHPERPEEYVDRPDAEMAVWTALVLRRYVGMRLRSSRTQNTARSGSSTSTT